MQNGKDLGIDLLHSFVAITSEGSLTRAAQKLNMTQQSLSAQLKRLEQATGRELLIRTAQGVRPTQHGEALLVYARSILAVSEQLRHHFSSQQIAGSIRIGLLEGLASTVLPVILGALRRLQPNLEIFADTGRTETLMERFRSRDLDLVLGGQRSGDGQGEALWQDKLSWVGHDELLDDAGRPVPLVMLPMPSQLREVMLEALENAGRTWTIFFESDSRTSLRSAVVAGLGVTVFANGIDAQELRTPLIDPDALPELGYAEFFLAKRSGAAVDMFADVVRSMVPALSGAGPAAF